MAKAIINSGICGFTSSITAAMDGEVCRLVIESGCPHIQKLAAELKEVDPLKEISARRNPPQTLALAARICPHAACPVPVGVIKAVEVAAGLALPADVSIKVSKE